MLTESELKAQEKLIKIITDETKQFVTKDTVDAAVPVQIMEDEDIKDLATGIANKIQEHWELAG